MDTDSENQSYTFYASKPRLVHVALNIAIAPVLLYLVGAWALPPQIPHYIVFAITGLLGYRYARLRWNSPRLVLDDSGLTCGEFYPADAIYRVQPALRSVVLTLQVDGEMKEKVVSLGWTSRNDYKTIIVLLGERFQRELPEE